MYQLRHKKLGYFQGIRHRKAYWTNFSNAIEAGIYPFRSVEAIRDLVKFACAPERPERLRLQEEDLTIEPFDRELDEQYRDLKLHEGACEILARFSWMYGSPN